MKLDTHEFGVKTFIDLFDYSSDLIFVLNNSGEFVDVNKTVVDTYGYTKEELIGKRFDILVDHQSSKLTEIKETFDQVWETENSLKIEVCGKKKDGSVFLKDLIVRSGIYFGRKVLIGTARDITENKKNEQILLETNQNLKKLNHELDSFVWKVSHDLRGPLASIKGIINLIQTEPLSNTQVEYCSHMNISVAKLIEFIKELEIVARNKTTEIRPEQVDLQGLLEELLKDYLFGDITKGSDITVSVDNVAEFFSDRSRLKSIFLNLITNAYKYRGKKRPEIKVDVFRWENGVKCIIADNGIGIEKELQSKVFDMFFRVSSEQEGSGLGLYIVKEAINKLGGNIELTSTVGKGTIMEFWVPNLK